jgi:hypothetical protein
MPNGGIPQTATVQHWLISAKNAATKPQHCYRLDETKVAEAGLKVMEQK